MYRCALVTGGSGFLGSYIVRDLLDEGFSKIYVLMRGASEQDALERLRALWWNLPVLADALDSVIVPICGDITKPQFGLADDVFDALASEVNYVFHAAAEIGVNETVDTFGTVNVIGTEHALEFALAANRTGAFKRFVHVSTAYVAGAKTGRIMEEELVEAPFNSLYEQSKFGAEQLVRDCAQLLPINIVRPAQIVGDSKTGFVYTFNTLYYPLKLYMKGRLSVLPVGKTQRVNMVPVDFVSNMIVACALNEDAQGKTFHAVIPEDHQPTVEQLVDYVRAWSKENLNWDSKRVVYANVPFSQEMGRARNLAPKEAVKKKSALQNMLALAPYFNENKSYDVSNAVQLGFDEYPDWNEYLGNLLAYAVRMGFLNHTDRTVFQQVMVRLSAKRNTITYVDIAHESQTVTSAAEMKELIDRAASALASFGIKQGDRVAIAGVNSVRYFAIDVAIGLLGACSVPLYYTMPANELVSLVGESGAKLVFLGTQKLLADAPEQVDVPCVSLLDTCKNAIGWESFLAWGKGPITYPRVPFDAVATVRYTSGTTGKPKGVMFTQAQLRWMGEVMPSLLDWETRNESLRYLSFLPMSHVVEGILVAYAPYYILSDITMCYLNDFDALAESLPKVRPSLFFSVPRFYEKVWNQFESSSIGKTYLGLDDAVAKRTLGALARKGLLRKAGLDKCRQLIVGSASVSLDLLQAFRELGIEIHNAYGVTEAPLITLSRLGNNELGSVGELLPDTEVLLTDDNEIFVKGPQVAIGYDGLGSCCDEKGFFDTGDYGSWSENNNLVIGGRKKELLITSYGKNISPEKVETMLKGINGVSEALLVGEGKPYVCALLWLEDEARETIDFSRLDSEVLRCNENLSHPEQVKRWAIMNQTLSISKGELTPNLKLRRRNVTALNEATIEDLYQHAEQAANALHVGMQP